MNPSDFRGTTVALVTPFDDDGELDMEALGKHVERQIDGGVDVLLPCGTTGESVTLSPGEQRTVIAEVVTVADGRVPVMAGAGTNATAGACALAKAAREVGADAVLSVAPYYNKPTQEGLYCHFEAVTLAAEIPLFVYNVPGRTSVNVQPETLLRLAVMEDIWGVKEASGKLGQMATILQGRPADFLVLSGDDEFALPLMALGGDGVVSVVANEAPELVSEMVDAGLAGAFAQARELHFRLLSLMRANFVQTNPIPVKTALEIMGEIGTAHFRLPLAPPAPETRRVLKEALESAGLLR